jgi:O-antigen/teichoic acid export membrane protein
MKAQSLSAMLRSALGLRLAMAALNFGLFWLLSHRLSAGTLGGFSLLMNVFLLVQVLPLLGLNPAFIRRAAAEPGAQAIEVSNGVAFAVPVALVLALGVGIVGQFSYGPELHAPFWCLALAVLPTAWTLVAEVTLLGQERMNDIARVQGAEALLRLLGAAVVVLSGGGLLGIFAVIAALRFAVALAYAAVPGLPLPQWRLLQAALWRRNWHEVPLFLGIALLATLSARLDLIVLSRLRSLEDVGVYAAAAKLYEASLMLPTVVALSMMPALSRLFATDRLQFDGLLVQALRVSLSGGALVALAVVAGSDLIVQLLYAPAMAGSAAVLRWLIVGAVLMTADQILSSTMMAARAQAWDMRSLVVGLVSLLLGLWVLVPWWGPMGAGLAVTLGLLLRVTARILWASAALQVAGLRWEYARQLLALAAGLLALHLAWDGGVALRVLAAWAGWCALALATGLVQRSWWQDCRAVWQTWRHRPR